MTLWGDQRAAAIQVGAAVLLGFVVIAISTYQVQVVPSQNAEVEFDHNQRVQEQLQQVYSNVVGVADGDGDGSQALRLGTTYPPRTIFLNAPPPSGTVRTTDSRTIRIDNASAVDSDGSGAYWDGSEWTTTTRSLVYEPRYHYYNNAPESVMEHGMFYNRPPNGQNITVADEILIDGDEITVVSLRGEYLEASSGTASVRTRALSRTENTVSVEPKDSNSNVTITIPTKSPTHWQSELEDESSVVSATPDGNNVTVKLEDDTYELRIASVGVGDASRGETSERATYVTEVDDSAPVAVAEVRDQFNNPVRNAEVNYSINGGTTTMDTTNRDGQLRVDGVNDGDTVKVWINSSDYTSSVNHERVKIGVTSGGGGGGSSAYGVSWKDPSGEPGTNSCSDSACTLNASVSETIDLTMATSPVADGASVEYALGNGTIASLNESSDTTDSDGEDAVELDASENGTVNVYTSSGSDGDSIEMTIEKYGVAGSGGSGPPTVVFTDNNGKLNTSTIGGTLSEKGRATGPFTDLDDDGTSRIPYVVATGSNSDLIAVVQEDGTNQAVLSSTSAAPSPTRLAAGEWTGSTGHVYFVGSNGEKLHRVDATGSEETVYTDSENMYAVSGIGDVTDDGTDELIYVDQNDQLQYLDNMSDTSDTRFGHGSSIGQNNGIGVGDPADFDDDGQARVPIVDGGNNLKLVDVDGNEQQIWTGVPKTPLRSVDWDNDGDEEIVYVDSGALKYVDDVTGRPTIKPGQAGANANEVTGAT